MWPRCSTGRTAAGVSHVITVADDLAAARWAAEASTWDPRVFAAVAVHPTRTASFGDAEQGGTGASWPRYPRVVAIGETGLDYYWDYSPPAAQHEAFRWHIDLSKRVGKPLMIHDRDAHEDILKILDAEGAPSTVVFHCFSGDADFARRCVDARVRAVVRRAGDVQERARRCGRRRGWCRRTSSWSRRTRRS